MPDFLTTIDWAALIATVVGYATKLITAIIIFYVGRWVVSQAVNLVKKLMVKASVDETLVAFSGNILYALGLAFVVIAALSKVGIETTSLAAAIAAAGLAIGLALQGSLSNLAAGVMIILFAPFKIGDFIEADDVTGTVEDISIFTTALVTLDNRSVIVPNGAITGGKITNFTAKPYRRVDLTVGVAYKEDLKQVKDVLNRVVKDYPNVLKTPTPDVAVSELADSSVNLVVRPYVKHEHYWDVYFGLTEAIKTTFDQEGISIPFPQRDVHFFNPSPETV